MDNKEREERLIRIEAKLDMLLKLDKAPTQTTTPPSTETQPQEKQGRD